MKNNVLLFIFRPFRLPSNTISLLRLTNSIPDVTILHTLIHRYHCFGIVTLIAFQLRSTSCYPQIVVLLPPSRLYFVRDQASPGTLCFTRIRSHAFTAHFPHPYLHISLHWPYHLYNTVHYIKNHYVAMYKLLRSHIHHLPT
jgi:hypothetical protein